MILSCISLSHTMWLLSCDIASHKGNDWRLTIFQVPNFTSVLTEKFQLHSVQALANWTTSPPPLCNQYKYLFFSVFLTLLPNRRKLVPQKNTFAKWMCDFWVCNQGLSVCAKRAVSKKEIRLWGFLMGEGSTPLSPPVHPCSSWKNMWLLRIHNQTSLLCRKYVKFLLQECKELQPRSLNMHTCKYPHQDIRVIHLQYSAIFLPVFDLKIK